MKRQMKRRCYKRRDFLKLAGTTAASLLVSRYSAAPAKDAPVTRPPGFLFIFIDDMGWGDVGFNGGTFYQTPNIDRLARQGMVFTSAYANAPNCAPSRACLMSGQYTPKHGVYTVGTSARGKANLRKLIPVKNKVMLDPETTTIAEALKSAGYVCGHFGKWHLASDKNYRPGRLGDPGSQGFDDVLTTRKPSKKKDPKADAHNTRQITDRAIAFLKNNKDKPFFCYVSHNTIHTPLMENPRLIAKYEAGPGSGRPGNNPVVAAMIETLDANVGRLLDKLENLKIADNTVVFFFSDNGGVFSLSSMGPLRGGKGTLYEGGIRVPLAVRWPGRIKPGVVCDVPVIGIDFYPTMLDMAGAAKPSSQPLDGQSLVPLLKGRAQLERRAIFWHFPAYLESNYGYPGNWRTTPVGSVRTGDYKLIEFFEDGRLELYNLKEDIAEKNNLAERMPEKTGELHKLLTDWRNSVNAPVPTERNPKYDPNMTSATKTARPIIYPAEAKEHL